MLCARAFLQTPQRGLGTAPSFAAHKPLRAYSYLLFAACYAFPATVSFVVLALSLPSMTLLVVSSALYPDEGW